MTTAERAPAGHRTRIFEQSTKLQNVHYDIRGAVHHQASALEAAGHSILRLNIGNPALFGFEAPPEIVTDMKAALANAQGYSESKGIVSARECIVRHYAERGNFPAFDVEDVYLGNGVSELIAFSLQALLNPGDEVLVPSPNYPLWTASTALAGGTPVHYRTSEADGWNPDLEHMAAQITERTKAIVIINPNNPTGAVYDEATLRGVAELARTHGLLLFSDEIYDRILYGQARHTSIANVAPDLLCITFNGLSKTYRVAGYRSGWMIITGPKERASGYLQGLNLLTSMRLCSNVPGQHAIAASLSGLQSIDALIAPDGRLTQQRDIAWRMLNQIPGVSCVEPLGALYAFPRLDPNVHEIRDDEQFVLDLLRQEHLLVVHGTAFSWHAPDHFRIVTLPQRGDLAVAIERIGNFLASYRQG